MSITQYTGHTQCFLNKDISETYRKQEKCDILIFYTQVSIRQQIQRCSFADGPQDKSNKNVQYRHHKRIVRKYHK